MQVYENCKIYGPYVRKDKRMHVCIVWPDGKRKTVSYPKYLMEIKLNKYLLDNETVDHIDRNFSNNEYSNLQILDRSEHIKLDAIRVKSVILKCQICNKEFELKERKLNNAIQNRKKDKSGPYCSKKCAGIATHFINNKMIKIETEHYKIEK